MTRPLIIICILALVSCSSKDKYSIDDYYDAMAQDSVLTSVVAHVFSAPPYTQMKDRFKPEYRQFYSSQSSKFSIDKFYVAEDGKNYFFLIRPGSRSEDKRGVGGYFKVADHYQLAGFREIFVTPELPEKEVKERGGFLFDEMVKSNIAKYIRMPSYVQWPNDASEYDTIGYEWKFKAKAVQ